jgi:hypothetical protein
MREPINVVEVGVRLLEDAKIATEMQALSPGDLGF